MVIFINIAELILNGYESYAQLSILLIISKWSGKHARSLIFIYHSFAIYFAILEEESYTILLKTEHCSCPLPLDTGRSVLATTSIKFFRSIPIITLHLIFHLLIGT